MLFKFVKEAHIFFNIQWNSYHYSFIILNILLFVSFLNITVAAKSREERNLGLAWV